MKPVDAASITTPADAARVVIFADDDGRAAHLHDHVTQSRGAAASIETMPLHRALEDHPQPPPALVILDVQTSGTDPLQFIKHIKLSAPSTRIMMIVKESHPDLAQRALRAGVSAYLTNDEVDALMPHALARIAEGERFVSDDVMQGILQGMVASVHREERLPIEQLSDRELMIFQMLGLGKSIRTIASELRVNIKTVATHCNNIRHKLHSRDNHELANLGERWVAQQHLTHVTAAEAGTP